MDGSLQPSDVKPLEQDVSGVEVESSIRILKRLSEVESEKLSHNLRDVR